MENTELSVVHCGWDNGDNRFSLIKTKGKERERACYVCLIYRKVIFSFETYNYP